MPYVDFEFNARQGDKLALTVDESKDGLSIVAAHYRPKDAEKSAGPEMALLHHGASNKSPEVTLPCDGIWVVWVSSTAVRLNGASVVRVTPGGERHESDEDAGDE